jgi:hypothetical protein
MEESLYPRSDVPAMAPGVGSGTSAASWPAIFAGSFVAIGASIILLTLGSGLGFASMSPWSDHGVSGTTFAVTSAIWLIVTQWISAGLGGYIAGRLRTRWHGTHTHEIFFRDTAHGLVTWAVATVAVAALVGSSMHSMIAGGVRAASALSSAAVQGAGSGASSPVEAYTTDTLFRTTNPSAGGPNTGYRRIEADHILGNTLVTGSLPIVDRTYLSDVVAANTGVSASDAEVRVNNWFARNMEAEAKVKADADAARKAAAKAALFTALGLLIGAFIGSVAAAVGGRIRDEHP